MVSLRFRTRESKFIVILILFVLIIIGIIIYRNYSEKTKYEEKAAMAKRYLEEGRYELAVEAYNRALSMKSNDQEILSIGLAKAYTGINNYDKALEVLRACYQKTGGVIIKEKIEEVTSMKTDYEFLQTISHADTYYSNGEFEKAIAEYEKAKLIKSREVVSYRRIAESYIALGDYVKAREEVKEGLELTQDEGLNDTLSKVDSNLIKIQYNEIVNEASEYIYQENYKDAIDKYNEAISLMPEEESAYNHLAEVYISQGKYDDAVSLLNTALRNVKSGALKEVLNKALALKAEEDEKEKTLKELYTAVNELDTDKITEIMKGSFFKEKIMGEDSGAFYYHPYNDPNTTIYYGMIIHDKQRVYSGGIREGMKKGFGTYFTLIENGSEQGWFSYEGEWENDVPNGIGKTTEQLSGTDEEGKTVTNKTVTEGVFSNGKENGEMHKTFYTHEEELGNVSYSAKDGTPQLYLNENGQEVASEEPNRYVIGELYIGKELAGDYYSIARGTVWGVKDY